MDLSKINLLEIKIDSKDWKGIEYSWRCDENTGFVHVIFDFIDDTTYKFRVLDTEGSYHCTDAVKYSEKCLYIRCVLISNLFYI